MVWFPESHLAAIFRLFHVSINYAGCLSTASKGWWICILADSQIHWFHHVSSPVFLDNTKNNHFWFWNRKPFIASLSMSFWTKITMFRQGLVTVPFWEYWTSPYSSHYRPYTQWLGDVQWGHLMTHVSLLKIQLLLRLQGSSLRSLAVPGLWCTLWRLGSRCSTSMWLTIGP